MSLRIAILDDHMVFRDALRAFLTRQANVEIELVGEASDSREAFRLVQESHPDVILVDIALRGVDGIATTRELLERDPRARVLVLSMYEDEHHIARALAAGARGYALKAQPGEQVLDAIRAVSRGESYLPPAVSRQAVEDLLRSHLRQRKTAGPLAPLSSREREVFTLLVRGVSNDAIAQNLCISVKTVETHRAHILKKLHVHSVAELVRFAATNQLMHD